MHKKKSLVSICIITYNHEKYISKAIESILMQKTDFSFDIVIGEDFSTDRTKEILIQYKRKNPEKIHLLLHTHNIGSLQNFILTLTSCRGKYIAILEGDDYWTDPCKLQKQVDFLEANPEYGLVSSDKVLIKSNGDPISNTEFIFRQRKYRHSGSVFWSLLMNVNFISTLTVCIRAEPIKKLTQTIVEQNLWYVYDLWFWLNVALDHKMKVMTDKMAAYRMHDFSISKSNGFFSKRSPLVRQYIVSKLLKEKKSSSFSIEQKQFLASLLLSIILNRHLTIREKKNTLSSIISNSFLWGYIFMIFVKAIKKKIKQLYYKMAFIK